MYFDQKKTIYTETDFEQTELLTNSRKHEDDYYCVAKLTAEDSQYYNTISAPNVSPHVPPPLTASTCGEQRQLALECRDVNTSDLELLTPSYCRRCLL